MEKRQPSFHFSMSTLRDDMPPVASIQHQSWKT
jgi:hypothetical protein